MSAAEARPRAGAAGQAAYVLHAYDWSESSLILDLFTREEGRQVVAAKGAKRPYSQLRSVLMPFQQVQVQLSRLRVQASEDEVRTLRSAEWGSGSAILPPQRLLSAYYLNELLMKFLPRGDAHPPLFDQYHGALAQLAVADAQGVPAALRSFELLLLRQMGLLPDLAQETLSGAVLQEQAHYELRPELGLVRVPTDAPAGLPGRQWLALQAALLSGHMTALRGLCREARVPLRALLPPLLAYHLGGATLRTRELMHALRRLGITADLSSPGAPAEPESPT